MAVGKEESGKMAESEGFEPSMELLTPYSLSRGAPSAARPTLQIVQSFQRPFGPQQGSALFAAPPLTPTGPASLRSTVLRWLRQLRQPLGQLSKLCNLSSDPSGRSRGARYSRLRRSPVTPSIHGLRPSGQRYALLKFDPVEFVGAGVASLHRSPLAAPAPSAARPTLQTLRSFRRPWTASTKRPCRHATRPQIFAHLGQFGPEAKRAQSLSCCCSFLMRS